jgi:RNA polymerase sigma factor (sigma-70 family)
VQDRKRGTTSIAKGRGDSDPPLQAEALREIELSLHGKLRAHRLSESFIERYGQDALQQGLTEYVRAIERGAEIENPDAWVVTTAFRRAIDELRREVRRADGAAVEAVLAGGGSASPAADEAALAHLEADQLREVIATLAPEQRQALSLYYFEERSGRESARALGCSERTFRRRLDSALEQLRQRFGIAVPEPDSELAIAVGLAAWASLAGARVVPTPEGPFAHVLAAADALRRASAGLGGRARELAARLTLGGGEGIGAAASGPLGKATGACVGALAACALTGVIGPGVGGVDLLGGDHAKPPVRHEALSATRRQPSPAPSSAQSSAPAEPASSPASPSHRRSRPQRLASGPRHSRRATREATSQFGVESAPSPGVESAPPAEHSESSASPPSSSASPSPTEVANEQFSP